MVLGLGPRWGSYILYSGFRSKLRILLVIGFRSKVRVILVIGFRFNVRVILVIGFRSKVRVILGIGFRSKVRVILSIGLRVRVYRSRTPPPIGALSRTSSQKARFYGPGRWKGSKRATSVWTLRFVRISKANSLFFQIIKIAVFQVKSSMLTCLLSSVHQSPFKG